MGLFRIFREVLSPRFLARRFIELVILIILFTFLPGIPPNAKYSKSTKVVPRRPLKDGLAINNKLDKTEIWHKSDLYGPEAFAHYNNELYTSLHGGDIVKLTGNHITPVVKFGKPCSKFHEEKLCGRPLGLKFDKNGVLYVADAYYGIFKVNVKTGDKERLVAFGDVIGGRNVTLPNSVAIADNGDVFWTDSSTEFELQNGVFDLFADGSGRLIHYNAKTKENKVLISDIHFANGVMLSDDEEFVIVAESSRSRVLRYYLKGPKKGTQDVFVDGLPGVTDNINSDGKGGFLIPLVIPVDDDFPALGQILAPFPLIRKFISRLFGVAQFSLQTANDIYSHDVFQIGTHLIGHFSTVKFLPAKRTTIVHIAKDGEILDSISTVTGKISTISEAHIYKDMLYLGSPFNDYIGRIPLSELSWDHLKQVQPAAATPKPTTTTIPQSTTTTPKPTTTTPKPTTTTTPKPTTTTTSKPTTTTPKPTTTQTPTTTQKPTTTPKPTTTTPKPTTTQTPTTTQKPPTTTQKSTTTQRPTTTTQKPAATTQKPTATTKPATPTQKPAPAKVPEPVAAAPPKANIPPLKATDKPEPKTPESVTKDEANPSKTTTPTESSRSKGK